MNLDLDELGRDITEKIRMDRSHRRPLQFSPFGWSKSWLRVSVLVGIWTLILIVAYVLFLRPDGGVSGRNFDAVQARVIEVENKLAQMEDRLESLQRALKKRDGSIAAETSRNRYHTVRYGDTLSKIALEYDLTVQELCRLNNITPQAVIREGQKLVVAP